MKPLLRSAAWATALVVALAGAANAQILAQVNPVKISLTARPGWPLHRDVQVSNLGDQAVAVRVRLSDWRLSEDGELSLAPAGSTPGSLAGLANFEPAEFTLAPGQNRWVHVTLTLPEQGAASRWGILLSEVRAATPAAAPAGSIASTELGTTIFLSRIPADEVRVTLGTPGVIALGGDSIQVRVRVHNTGLRQVGVAAAFALADSSGTRIRTTSSGSGIVLPGEARRFSWICVTNLSPGDYRMIVTLADGESDPLTSEKPFRWPPALPAGSVASRPAR